MLGELGRIPGQRRDSGTPHDTPSDESYLRPPTNVNRSVGKFSGSVRVRPWRLGRYDLAVGGCVRGEPHASRQEIVAEGWNWTGRFRLGKL